MDEHHEEMYKKIKMVCIEREGVTEFEMANKGVPTAKSGKCLNACVLEQLGIVS